MKSTNLTKLTVSEMSDFRDPLFRQIELLEQAERDWERMN